MTYEWSLTTYKNFRLELLVYSTRMDPECASMMGVLLVTLLHRLGSFIKTQRQLFSYEAFFKNELCFISMQTIRKHPMTVYGDGKQTRSFQYVSDLVSNNLCFNPLCCMI